MAVTVKTMDMKYMSPTTEQYIGVSSLHGNTIPATSNDIGKALSPKTVSNGYVTQWKYVSVSGGGGGGSITVDDELDSTSENPVQNKVIYAAIGNLETLLAAL